MGSRHHRSACARRPFDLRRDAFCFATIHAETVETVNLAPALKKARPPARKKPAGGREWEGGLIACQAVGIIGQTVATYDSEKISGIISRKGEPYLHTHATIAGETFVAQLIGGCIVRSLHKRSHFTITLAKTKGATLSFDASKEVTTKYPTGTPIHRLVQD